MNFFDISFWQGLVSNTLATLSGVVVGIPVALWINRLVTQTQEATQNKTQLAKQNQRKKQFFQMLSEALQKNLDLVEKIEREVRPNFVIYYNVDTQLLEATSSIKYEIIENLDLNKRIDSIRYELLHLHRKVELQLEIEYSAYKAFSNYIQSRTLLVGAIIAHIPRIKNEITEALQIIKEMSDQI